MSTLNDPARSSVARTQRYRARRRQGARCILVDVNETDVAALVARSYLPEEASQTQQQSRLPLRALSLTCPSN